MLLILAEGLVFVLQAFYQVISGDFNEEDIKAPDNAELDQMVKELHAGAQASSSLDQQILNMVTVIEIMVQIGKGTNMIMILITKSFTII